MTDSSSPRYQLSDLVIDPSRILAVDDPGALTAHVLRDTIWWLDVLGRAHDAAGIARVRRQIARVERAMLTAQAPRPVQLDLAELARRAERSLGQAIRWGQAHGMIRSRGQRPGITDIGLASPTTFAPKEVLARGAYIYAEASEEDWEATITDSRMANDLSRADIVRRLRDGRVSGRPDRKPTMVSRTRAAAAARRRRIKELAETGYNSHQIGRDIGIDPSTVRDIAKEIGVTISADAFVRHSKVLDPNRLIDETVMAVDGHASSLSLLDGRWADVDPDKIDGWLSSLNASLTSLQGLRRQLKELTHGN